MNRRGFFGLLAAAPVAFLSAFGRKKPRKQTPAWDSDLRADWRPDYEPDIWRYITMYTYGPKP